MGGNALKNTFTRRYKAAEFRELASNMLRKLREVFAEDTHNISVIRSYADKESFGDMDILIAPVVGHAYVMSPSAYAETIHTLFGPKDLLRNGNVLSFDVHQLQIDLIVCKADEYESSCNYFAYNDLGNLLGRLAHSVGVKLGHDGLSYVWRDGTHVFATEVLTRDWSVILDVLGLDFERYTRGFKTKREIFDFVVTSNLFTPEIYLLNNRNNASRTRDRKRETYTEFLLYCEQQFPNYAVPTWLSKNKADHLPALFELIPGFAETYARVQSDYEKRQRASKLFNGSLVSAWTGLQKKELGMFMRYLREQGFDQQYVLSLADEDTVCNSVKHQYADYQANYDNAPVTSKDAQDMLTALQKSGVPIPVIPLKKD